ncbi:SpoIIE family protein phosphatase [Blastococcus sp. TF02A-26]|uniref:SpoIIE family protein phosphatase n=1 Tax=Blastococcus sp. TF02A-26 TaxID=2250577 RepID=UPI001F1D62C8|nr:SpoIIE family protein phosphatase [Blastococcus sp. TF02A-26]
MAEQSPEIASGVPAPRVRPEAVELTDVVDPTDARQTLLDLATTAAGIGTFDWDLATGLLEWDERMRQLFGYDEDAFGRSIEAFNDRLHPEDLPRVGLLLQQAIDTCGDYEAEYRVILPGGSTRWIAARGRALCDERGVTNRVLGAAWDVTSHHEAQDSLARILENMAVGFFTVDRSWVFTRVNAEGERILAAHRSDLLGQNVWQRFPAAVGSLFEVHYRHAVAIGEPVSFDAYYPEPLDIWVEVRAVPTAEGLSVYFLDITERRRLQERVEHRAGRERLLSRIGEQLDRTLDPGAAAQRLARLVVPDLADWSVVTLVDDERGAGSRRGLRNAGSFHIDPAMRPVAEAYAHNRLTALTDDAIIVRAVESDEVQLIERDATTRGLAMLAPGLVRESFSVLAPEAVAVIPLPGSSGPVGLLTLANGRDRGPFGDDDLEIARQIAGRAGLALDAARLFRQQQTLAETLQRSMFTAPPEPDHLQVVVRYLAASQAAQVGGDWYDAFLEPDGATVLAIGDVVGHDARAAAHMGQIRTILRALGADQSYSPAELLRHTDRVMETLQVETAATAVVARLEQSASQARRGLTVLRWANAGHPPPFVINPNGSVALLQTAKADLLLGVRPDTDRLESEVILDRDSVVLLYTDGLVERRDQDLDEGLRRLHRTLEQLAGSDLDDLCDELLARLVPESPDDDVAIVAVRLHPQDKPRPAEAGPNRIPPNVPVAPPVIPQPN